MVHALQEIHRILIPDGILIDIRPVAEGWPVEVNSFVETRVAGHVSDPPEGLEQDRRADQATLDMIAGNWFTLERSEFFPFFYYWDSPGEMKEYIDEEWQDFATIEDPEWDPIRSLWAVANADARLRIRVKILITRLKKSAKF